MSVPPAAALRERQERKVRGRNCDVVNVLAAPYRRYAPRRWGDLPTEPATPGRSTPGGLWNVFRKGKWVAPPNRGATTLRGLPRPRVPGPPSREKPNLKE